MGESCLRLGANEERSFSWWVRRFRGTQNLVDIIRVDHFAGSKRAGPFHQTNRRPSKAKWVKAPGMALFQEIRKQLGDVPIVAEDLGLITPEVEHLRDANQFPGMRVLQFAFDSGPGPKNHFLPHNFIPYSVVYTGTHDNDTTVGWYATRDEKQRTFLTHYLGYSPGQVAGI